MKIASFSYFVTEGFESVFKNKSMSFASIATIIVCIFMLGITFFTLKNLEFNIQNIETDVNITAFLDDNMTEDQILELKGLILKNLQIKKVEYISKSEAFKRFTSEEEFSKLKGDTELQQVLPASFEIRLNDNRNQKEVEDLLAKMKEIVALNNPREAMKLITDLKDFIQNTSVVIIGILVGVGIILIGNTIKLTVFMRRNEIKVMKYIGATDWFIRWPFVIEGLFIGFLGTIIPLIILFFLYNFFVNMFESSVPTGAHGIIYFMSVSEIYQTFVPIALLLGLGMGIVGSLIIIRKHLQA